MIALWTEMNKKTSDGPASIYIEKDNNNNNNNEMD